MHDLVAPIGVGLFGPRRLTGGHLHDDLAAEAVLIEPEGVLALSVECQMRAQLHDAFLVDSRLDFDASAGAAIVKVLEQLLMLVVLFIFSNRSHLFVRRTEFASFEASN